jgi:hypothetical protein
MPDLYGEALYGEALYGADKEAPVAQAQSGWKLFQYGSDIYCVEAGQRWLMSAQAVANLKAAGETIVSDKDGALYKTWPAAKQ